MADIRAYGNPEVANRTGHQQATVPAPEPGYAMTTQPDRTPAPLIPAQRGPLPHPAPTGRDLHGPAIPGQRCAAAVRPGRHAAAPAPIPAQRGRDRRVPGNEMIPGPRGPVPAEPRVGRRPMPAPPRPAWPVGNARRRSSATWSAALDVVGRVGSAVSLAALLVVATAVGALADDQVTTDTTPLTATFDRGE